MRANKTVEKKDEGTDSAYRPLVPALDQAVQILLCLQENSGEKMTLTKVCQAVGIHKSKGHSILTTLQKYGLVERDPQAKTYTLGASLIPLARTVLDHLDFRAVAMPFVESLARETGMTVWFAVRRDDSLFVVSKYEGGGHFWATPGIGHTFRLSEKAAHSKAVLAFLPESELSTLPAAKLSNSLRKELSSIRETGYASDLGEFAKGINAVAAPVFGPGGQVIGVLLLFGTFSEDKTEKYGRKAASIAQRISQKLGN